MTGSQGESQSRGSLAARPGKDKIEEVAKNVEEILKTFRPSWRYNLQYQFCWKTNTPKKRVFIVLCCSQSTSRCPNSLQSQAEPMRQVSPRFCLVSISLSTRKISCLFFFLVSRLSKLPILEDGGEERTQKDIFDFQEEEEDGDAPRNGKYTLKSVKKIDHYSRLVIFGENV